MTEHKKPPSFAEILDLTWGHGGKIKKLARILKTDNPFAMSGDPYDEIAAELAETVNAVRTVMVMGFR